MAAAEALASMGECGKVSATQIEALLQDSNEEVRSVAAKVQQSMTLSR